MRFGPDPAGVDQPDFLTRFVFRLLQAAHLGQAERHELPALKLAPHPLLGILVPSLAAAALVQCSLRADPPGHVGGAGEARRAGVRRVGSDWHAAHATENIHHGTHCGGLDGILHDQVSIECLYGLAACM